MSLKECAKQRVRIKRFDHYGEWAIRANEPTRTNEQGETEAPMYLLYCEHNAENRIIWITQKDI